MYSGASPARVGSARSIIGIICARESDESAIRVRSSAFGHSRSARCRISRAWCSRIAGSTEIKKRTLHGKRFIITKAEQNSSAFSTVRRTQQRHTSSEVCLRKCVSAYYKMMQISPPLPSLIIRDSVSPNFSRASSGICSSFA